MPIYDKPTRILARDFVKDTNLIKGNIFTRKDFIDWFAAKYPNIKKVTLNAHLTLLSVNAPSRIHYNASTSGESDLFFQIDGSRFRLYDKDIDPPPIYKIEDDSAKREFIEDSEDILESNEFAYERDLKNFLSKNLSLIESGLRLYEDDGITGVEFQVGGRFIDILALDKNNNYVVIELKVSKGYDRVIGQLLRYIAWIEQNQAEPNQKVRGVIIASNISEDLALAASKITDVEMFEYQLSVTLKKVK